MTLELSRKREVNRALLACDAASWEITAPARKNWGEGEDGGQNGGTLT